MTRYSRRHYEDVVLAIKKTHAVSQTCGAEWVPPNVQVMLTCVAIDTWQQLFRMESETFDPVKFVKAALAACEIDVESVPRTFLPPSVQAVRSDAPVQCEICGSWGASADSIRHTEEDCFK